MKNIIDQFVYAEQVHGYTYSFASYVTLQFQIYTQTCERMGFAPMTREEWNIEQQKLYMQMGSVSTRTLGVFNNTAPCAGTTAQLCSGCGRIPKVRDWSQIHISPEWSPKGCANFKAKAEQIKTD